MKILEVKEENVNIERNHMMNTFGDEELDNLEVWPFHSLVKRCDPVDVAFVDIWPRRQEAFRLLQIPDLCGIEECGPALGVPFIQYIIREGSRGIRPWEALLDEGGVGGEAPWGGVGREGGVLRPPLFPWGIRGELFPGKIPTQKIASQFPE